MAAATSSSALQPQALLTFRFAFRSCSTPRLGEGCIAIGFTVLRGKVRETASRVMLTTMGGSRGVVAGKGETLPYAVAFAFSAILMVSGGARAPFYG